MKFVRMIGGALDLERAVDFMLLRGALGALPKPVPMCDSESPRRYVRR